MDLPIMSLLPIVIFITVVPAIEDKLLWGRDDAGLCHLDSCKEKVLTNSSDVLSYCQLHPHNMTVSGRCCVHKDHQYITGLDLTSCNLNSLSILETDRRGHHHHTEKYQKDELLLLLLEDNPIHSCPNESFSGMSSLRELTLPYNCSCPGGGEAWRVEYHNSTGTFCSGMVDICESDKVPCPDHSHCNMSGPGMTVCLCDSGFHGYKCLIQGSFPFIPFLVGILASTAAVSGFLWLTIRRKVQKID